MNPELTTGEKMVGIEFNPANNSRVTKVKELYAEIINEIEAEFEERVEIGPTALSQFFHTFAKQQAVTAQMAAVKFITWGK
jgi:hypothetical protein